MAQQNTAPTFPIAILDFAFFPYRGPPLPQADAGRRAWPEAVASLAALAEPEDWTGQPNNTTAPNGILKNYISYTYQRLRIEHKISISADRTCATFNTGLLTRHGEEIFGHFAKNTRADKQPWVFKAWVNESNTAIMNHFFPPPEMAEYVAVAADLVYDMRQPLTLSTEHIIEQNLQRFPPSLQNEGMARMTLNFAKEMTLKRLRRNYKLAIPQWYPNLGTTGAQLLLPLDLTQSGTADLALVVSATEGGGYRGHTILTLEMAYSNARLVARPDSDWLMPQVGNSD
jgi:hypothetical protein